MVFNVIFIEMITSEKKIEAYLVRKIEQTGGMCIKLPALHCIGLPDRLCLLPGGRVIFVELKSKGKKPRRIQLVVQNRIRNLGFTVLVIDNTDDIDKLC